MRAGNGRAIRGVAPYDNKAGGWPSAGFWGEILIAQTIVPALFHRPKVIL